VTATQGNWQAFHRQALERVSALPGVEYAAFAWGVPLTGNDWPGEVEIEGMPPAAKASDRLQLPLRAVTPGYFALFNQAITAGRDFRPSDTRDAPGVAIINQELVERYLPHTNPLGKKLWPWGGRSDQGIKIVGVVANSRTGFDQTGRA
jgi:putative ABC transport system permease protein